MIASILQLWPPTKRPKPGKLGGHNCKIDAIMKERYSYAMAARTLVRAARIAGSTAASTPTSAASTR
jgi:hypothetical protein